MSERKIAINRRSFLRLAAATSASANLPAEMLKSGFFSPEEDMTLASPALSVAISSKTGVPTGYTLGAKKLELAGSDSASSIEVLLCRKEPWSVRAFPATVVGVQKETAVMRFKFSVQWDSQQAATFSLRYRITQSRVTVELDGVKEFTGYEFLEARLPSLVTIPRQVDGWMAHGDTGGALIELARAKPGTLAPNQFWGDILSTLPVLMAGNSKIFCLITIPAFMCGGAMSVSPSGVGSMGTILRHRVNGSQCADLNLGQGEPLNCGNASTPNLLVEQQATSHLEFFPIAGDWRQAWLIGAHHVRKQLPPKRNFHV